MAGRSTERAMYGLLLLTLVIFFVGFQCSDPRENAALTIIGDLGGIVAMPETPQPMKVTAEGDLTLFVALVGVRNIELKQVDEGDNEGELEFPGPYRIDLLDGAGSPIDACAPEQPGATAMQQGMYDRVEFEFDSAVPPDPACPLADKSVFVRGSVECGGVPVPFVFEDRFEDDVEVLFPTPISIDLVFSQIELIFFVESWFGQVDLCSAERTDGEILIDERHNPDLGATIRMNILQSAEADEHDEEGE